MSERLRTAAAVVIIVLIASATFFRGLDWGLPTRASDGWLFGGRPVWSGAQIIEKLGPAVSTTRGADVDATPILDRSKPVVLNDTNAKRAAIVQRFRLMSKQPDEFIQFKALAEMSQRAGLARLDPRLYQYGGLWIYPVGGLVRAAMLTGWIESPPAGLPAREFYLDRPDAFGKFYIVGRVYSAVWGVIATLAVFFIARSATRDRSPRDATDKSSRDATPSLVLGTASVSVHPSDSWQSRPATALRRGYWISDVLAMLAAIGFVFLPVVRTAAHEAKPHLAGAALCLWAATAAGQYVATGRRRWLLVAGALCGAAMGIVVSMALSLAILPAMVALRIKNPLRLTRGKTRSASETFDPRAASPSPQNSPPTTEERESSIAASVGLALFSAFAVYAVTNPFVLFNAFTAPSLLRSNLGNSTAMYGVHSALAMIPDAWAIATHAMTAVGLRLAVASLAALAAAYLWHGSSTRSSSAMTEVNRRERCTSFVLLLAPAALVTVQFILLAAGKPAEYARFGLVPAAAGCVAIAIAVAWLLRSPKGFGVVFLASLLVALLIPPIGIGNLYDAWRWPDEDHSALQLDTMRKLGSASGEPYRLGVAYEPAPWSTPPMDLFDTEIVLVRMTPEMLEDVDTVVWPINLERQLFEAGHDRESLDWRENRFGVRGEARDGEVDRWRGSW